MQYSDNTYVVEIFMAGDYIQAQQVCREFCMRGLCVTIHSCEYIYTGGQETGFVVGLRNYPRFPSTPDALFQTAKELANLLRTRLFQESSMIVSPTHTLWETTRESSICPPAM